MKALIDVAENAKSSAAARAGAGRTLLEALGVIGRMQDLRRLDDSRSLAEMSPDEISAEIVRLSEKIPKPRLRKVRTS